MSDALWCPCSPTCNWSGPVDHAATRSLGFFAVMHCRAVPRGHSRRIIRSFMRRIDRYGDSGGTAVRLGADNNTACVRRVVCRPPRHISEGATKSTKMSTLDAAQKTQVQAAIKGDWAPPPMRAQSASPQNSHRTNSAARRKKSVLATRCG